MKRGSVACGRLISGGAAIVLLAVSTPEVTSQSPISVNRLHGDWSGALRLEIPFRVILHLRSDGPGLVGNVDFPDQNANGLPLTDVRLRGDSVHLRLAPASIRFDGIYAPKGDSIHGTFAQGEQRFALTLRRSTGAAASPPSRPQEPVPPLPYSSEEVRFAGGGAGIALAGTLTLPPAGGPHPAVLLVPQLRWQLRRLLGCPLAEVAYSCYITCMVREVKLRQVGGSVGATLPKDMADRLHLAVGDSVLAIETDRGILLTPYHPTLERGLALAARAAKRHRHALRELAK